MMPRNSFRWVRAPLRSGARVAAVVVMLRQDRPAFVALAFDKRIAGFALGMQRVELLFKPLLGGFAGVDRTAQRPRVIALPRTPSSAISPWQEEPVSASSLTAGCKI